MVNCTIKILLFYIFFSHIAVCQTLSADEKKIGYDLARAVRSIGTGGADIIAESFGTLWQNGSFNNTHKALIRDIALKMKEKKYSINPHFMYLCSYTSFAIKRAGIQADSLTRLLEMNKFVIDHYSPKEYSDFLFLMNIFFVRNALVLKPHYQMYIRNGKYRFENQDTETVDPAFSIPTQEAQNVTKTDSVVEEGIAEEDTWNNQTEIEEIDNTEVASFLGFPTNTETKRGQQRIVFENADIIMVSYSDSVKIVNTSGSFFIPEKIWEGRGGEFQWSSRNNFFQTAQVSLAEYEFSVAKPEVFCKNVVLTFDALLDTKVIGDFAYKGILGTKKEKQTYPRFISYNNDIGVNMQDSFLTYRGCFAFEGAHLYGKCVDNSKISQLEITNTVGYKAVLQSTYFTLDKPIITSGDARFSLTHGEHSLDNHFVTLKYQTETKELLASSPHGSKKNSRFYSSFYKVYIKGDVLKWNMQADSLTISIDHAKDAVPVIVESDEYFSEDRYRKYMGLLPFHPLSLVKDYLHKKGQTHCSLEELTLFYTNIADSYAKRYALLLGAMKTLFYENLITFIAADEFENALFDAFGNKNYNISLTDLGKHYVESSQKKKDYDKIFIPSITAKQPNVVMNFQKEYMTINGVNSSFFTNDLKIYMLPDNETIKMHKGKNISLDGKVFTPTMAYIGKEFDFQYDSFLMRMNKIDSIRLYDPQDSLKRGSEDASLKNHIVNTTGVLRIALPHNKAGDPVKKISPKYISKDSSYIYFDSKEILGGAYNRKIYFVVPKMDVDNLNDKANNTIRLKGTFYSDNIIPTIQETLQMMPDRSLGFQHIIEPPGYLVYKGKGDFFGTIQLDNNGIVGTGKLAYSVALLESSKFIFYQDSASAQGFNGILQEKITIDGSFPKVEIEKYTMKWIPKKDIMLLHSKGNPFRFYNNTIVFDGVLILSQKALFGSGKLSTRGSITESKKYMFLQDEFSARNATFRVVSDNNYTDRVRGDNVKLQFSFSIGRVVIHPEEKNIPALSFPEAKIVTSIQTAVWDLKKEKIFMKNDIDQLHISSYFISTDPKTDSLKFIANKGEYDMQTFQINLDGVENVQIVDATVIPDKGKIIIRKGSEIPPLSNAVVHFITDPDTLHTFVKSNIKISSRKKSIQGTAQYTYTHTNKEISYYNFHEFVMDSTKIKSSSKYARRTIAHGVIEEKTTDFRYFPGFLLQAKATMYPDKKDLSIEGSIKPILKNIDVKNYLSFYKYNNELGVYSFLETAKLDESIPVHIGIYYDNRAKKMYHSFLTRKNDIADIDVFTAKGFFFYDKEKEQYRAENFSKAITTKLLDLSIPKDEEIISEEKDNQFLQKERFTYDDREKQMQFQGTFRFIEPQAEFFNITAAGEGNYKIDSSTMNFTGFLVFNFFTSPKSLPLIAEEIIHNVDNTDHSHSVIESNDYFTEHILPNIAHFLPESESQSLLKKLEGEDYISPLSISPAFLKPIVLSKIQMKWDRQKGTWYNPLASIGLANIGNTDINIHTKGFVEIIPDKSETFVSVFIYITEEVWFHFLYTQNKIFILSNNAEFNKTIREESKITRKSSQVFALQLGDWEFTQNVIETFQKKYFPKQKKLTVSFTVEEEIKEKEPQTEETEGTEGTEGTEN